MSIATALSYPGSLQKIEMHAVTEAAGAADADIANTASDTVLLYYPMSTQFEIDNFNINDNNTVHAKCRPLFPSLAV